MGTTYQVKLGIDGDQPLQTDSAEISKAIEKRLQDINQALSTYLEDSEISRFNRYPSTDPFAISADFKCVFRRSVEMHQLTDGSFDATVGPLVRLWGFGGAKPPTRLPSQEDLHECLKRVGTDKVRLVGDSLVKSHPNLELDFSAIAKGFAVDEVATIAGKHSRHFLVEIGGEVRTAGKNLESGKPWAIGVEIPADSPWNPASRMAARLELLGKALATSGDYRNLVKIEDRKFQHTLDPRSGFPVEHGVRSVSVIEADCMTADAIATGLMVKPLTEIQAFCKEHNANVFVIFESERGNLDSWASRSFEGQVLLTTVGQEIPEKNQKAENGGDNPLYLILGTVIVFGLAISGMAVGVIMSNRQLKGSCGGLSAMAGENQETASPCSLCTKPASECSKRADADSPREAEHP
ncbi:MAG: FAD:protein FMN transferase [Planctomycetota bacterium]|nr:FAD:protein FMN transferase [Planctomycetota bacterium]